MGEPRPHDRERLLAKLEEMQKVHAEHQRKVREREQLRADRLAAVAWSRWLCRFGWHRPVFVAEGDVGASRDHYRRFECAGGCDAYWLSRNGRPMFRA